MKGSRLISLVAIIATAMLLVPGILRAQQPVASLAIGASASATVKAVDPAARTVTLETADGDVRTIRCGAEVRNFDQIKVGDQVRAVAVERMVIGVGRSSAPGSTDATIIARTPLGSKPGVIIGGSEQITAKVDAVDTTTRTVTLQGADGQTRPLKVSADVDLAGVKKGDEVTLRVSKGVMLWVQSPQDSARLAAGTMSPQGALAAELVGLEAESATATATVEAVDPVKRIVTLKGPAGQTRQIYVGKEAINFDQIKVGDKVRATLAEEIAISVSKGAPAAAAADVTVITRAPAGSKPSIVIADSDIVTGKVQSIDADRRSITLVEADGKPRTIRVGPRVNLAELKAGDEINTRVTQAFAIAVEKP